MPAGMHACIPGCMATSARFARHARHARQGLFLATPATSHVIGGSTPIRAGLDGLSQASRHASLVRGRSVFLHSITCSVSCRAVSIACLCSRRIGGEERWEEMGRREELGTHSIQLIGVSDPLEHGVALKVVEEFEVVVAGDAEDLNRQRATESRERPALHITWSAGNELLRSSTHLLHTGLLEAFDDVLREFDVAGHCVAFVFVSRRGRGCLWCC